MAVIAFSDIRHYAFTDDGRLILAPSAPDLAMRAVRRVKRKAVSIPRGDGVVVAYETEVELWNKVAALRHLAEYLKLFKENRIDDPDEKELTPEQRRERVINLLKVARKRKRDAESVARAARAASGHTSDNVETLAPGSDHRQSNRQETNGTSGRV
jgi:hypothetical protein